MEVATAIETVTFESAGTHYRVLRRPAVDAVGAQGQVYLALPEEVIEFEPAGQVTLQRGEGTLPDGAVLTDDNGRMVLDDRNQPVRDQQDTIRYLLNHRDFGVRFWVKGLAPGTPLPSAPDVLAAMLDATIALNVVTLERLHAAELRTHGRPDVLMTLDNAISRVQVDREVLGDDAPEMPDDVPIPAWNDPSDLVRRPVNARDIDSHAAAAAAMAQPDNPDYAGGVRQ